MRTCPSRHAARGALVAACAAIALAGCATESRDYPGVTHDALWTAALDAANHPQYDDWIVAENGVFADEGTDRIEIHRELKRDRARDGGALRREGEEWALSVRLEVTDRIPKVLVASRSGFRSHGFLRQADHFFAEIDARLAQRGTGTAAPSQPAVPANAGSLEAPSALEASQVESPK